MKKYFSNIRTLAALLIAGAAFAACSSDDSIIEQPANPVGENVYTLTVNATKDGGDQTRALKLETSGALTAYWEPNDQITVINTSKSDSYLGVLLATNISADGKSATFTGSLNPEAQVEADDVLSLTYNSHYNISEFGGQNGILTSKRGAAGYDMATATVTVASVDGKKITTTDDASFETQTAMIKLTLKNGTNLINATSLNVKVTVGVAPIDIFTFTPTAATYEENGDGILYFALPSAATIAGSIASQLHLTESVVAGLLASATITFTASDGVNTYAVDKTGYPFAAGKYYTSMLSMTAAAPVPKAIADSTAGDVGKLIGADGNIYASKSAATTANTTAVAMIAYVGSASDCTHGLAIALTDEEGADNSAVARTYDDGIASIAARTAVSDGSTWRMPTVFDWQYMFIGCGATGTPTSEGSVTDYSGLETKLQTAGATTYHSTLHWAFRYDKYYWSSTTGNNGGVYKRCVRFSTAMPGFYDSNYDGYTRAVLAF